MSISLSTAAKAPTICPKRNSVDVSMVKLKKRGRRSVGWVQPPAPLLSLALVPLFITIRIRVSAADCVAARLLMLSREK